MVTVLRNTIHYREILLKKFLQALFVSKKTYSDSKLILDLLKAFDEMFFKYLVVVRLKEVD